MWGDPKIWVSVNKSQPTGPRGLQQAPDIYIYISARKTQRHLGAISPPKLKWQLSRHVAHRDLRNSWVRELLQSSRFAPSLPIRFHLPGPTSVITESWIIL